MKYEVVVKGTKEISKLGKSVTNVNKQLKQTQKNFDKLKKQYDDRFKRMWEYYLLMCAGTFRSRRNQLWQLVMSKHGLKGGYTYKNNPRFD